MNTIEKKIRIGIFFDGTGNNAQNALKRELSSEKTEGTGSYTIHTTNIYRLFKNYMQNSDKNTKAFYIEGIGTLDHNEDSTTSAATGHDFWEGYSAKAKTQKAFESLCNYLQEIALKNYENTINLSITLDLFGFSRGAALARNFANLITEKKTILKSILQNERHNLNHLEIGFIGLFDTVESIQLSTLNLSLDKVQAQGVFHLTAVHECRENFPLTSIFTSVNHYTKAHKKGSGFHPSKNHFELRVPGAHSDVGGGYLKNEYEVKTINLKATYTKDGAKTDAQQIIKNNPDFKSILDQLFFEFEAKSIGFNTISRRKNVKGDLQYIYGDLMLEIGKKFGVPFHSEMFKNNHPLSNDLIDFSNVIKEQSTQLLKREEITFELYNRLVALDQILKNYIHISVSTRTIFNEEDTKKDESDSKPLLKQTTNATTMVSSSVSKHLMVNRPTPNWQREIKFI